MHHRQAPASQVSVSPDTFTTLINLAGRQRMLSQRIVLNSILAGQGAVEAMDIARQSLSLFQATHQDLVHGNSSLPGVFFAEIGSIYFGEVHADLKIRAFIDQATRVLDTMATPQCEPLLQALGRTATPMVDLLNQLTQAYETESKRRTQIQRRQYTSLMGDIQRIAKQAKIVSVNAQIMAARAGDAGKEFSVVAGVLTNITGEMDDLILSAMQNA